MSVVILRGDAAILPLADASIDLIVTSPPFWGLRDYRDNGESLKGQIGSEATPREFLDALLACTREWMRVLKPEGSIFVNLGDAYSGRADGAAGRTWREDRAEALQPVQNTTKFAPRKSLMLLPQRYAIGCVDELGLILRAEIVWSKANGLPESVVDRVRRSHEQVFHFTKRERYFAGVDEIRRPHAMRPQRRPGGRPADLTPRQGQPRQAWSTARRDEVGVDGHPLGALPGSVWEIPSQPLTVPARLGADHFAAFPMELPRRIILGWSPSGICTACGEGRRPVVSSVALDLSRPQARRAHQLAERAGLTEDHLRALLSVGVSDTGRGAATQNGTGKNTPEVYALAAEARAALGGYAREYLLRRPTSFAYACACTPFEVHDEADRTETDPDTGEPYIATAGRPVKVYQFAGWTPPPARPALVVDPFGGTGTTALVADMLGRTGVTVDRSADYCRIAQWRTADPGERARALGVPKPPPVPDGQGSLFDGLEDGEAS